MAWRSSAAPQVMAYWLTSPSMARQAAALTSIGAGKSGIPWARLTAPCLAASIDIPRITLSVNRDDFSESRGTSIRSGPRKAGGEEEGIGLFQAARRPNYSRRLTFAVATVPGRQIDPEVSPDTSRTGDRPNPR